MSVASGAVEILHLPTMTIFGTSISGARVSVVRVSEFAIFATERPEILVDIDDDHQSCQERDGIPHA